MTPPSLAAWEQPRSHMNLWAMPGRVEGLSQLQQPQGAADVNGLMAAYCYDPSTVWSHQTRQLLPHAPVPLQAGNADAHAAYAPATMTAVHDGCDAEGRLLQAQPASALHGDVEPDAPEDESDPAGSAEPPAGGMISAGAMAGTSDIDRGTGAVERPNPRLKWTPELDARFVEALSHLGGPYHATPKHIRSYMRTPGLSMGHIKSHLQQFRHRRAGAKRHKHPTAAPEPLNNAQPLLTTLTTQRSGGVPSTSVPMQLGSHGRTHSPQVPCLGGAGSAALTAATSLGNGMDEVLGLQGPSYLPGQTIGQQHQQQLQHQHQQHQLQHQQQQHQLQQQQQRQQLDCVSSVAAAWDPAESSCRMRACSMGPGAPCNMGPGAAAGLAGAPALAQAPVHVQHSTQPTIACSIDALGNSGAFATAGSSVPLYGCGQYSTAAAAAGYANGWARADMYSGAGSAAALQRPAFAAPGSAEGVEHMMALQQALAVQAELRQQLQQQVEVQQRMRARCDALSGMLSRYNVASSSSSSSRNYVFGFDHGCREQQEGADVMTDSRMC